MSEFLNDHGSRIDLANVRDSGFITPIVLMMDVMTHGLMTDI